jgi:hypothetical protein
MRILAVTTTVLAMVLVVGPSWAKDLRPKDLQVCQWGAQTALGAQQSKLSGTTLYSARKKIQAHKYSAPWMRKMALGITEQTYKSKSRLRPAAVKQTYYEGCIKHEMARR